MDLEPHEVDELFERAHERFEASKRALPFPQLDDITLDMPNDASGGTREGSP